MPSVLSSGIESTLLPRKPITSARCGCPFPSRISQHSPTEHNGPEDSIVWPTASRTRPCQRHVERCLRREKYVASSSMPSDFFQFGSGFVLVAPHRLPVFQKIKEAALDLRQLRLYSKIDAAQMRLKRALASLQRVIGNKLRTQWQIRHQVNHLAPQLMLRGWDPQSDLGGIRELSQRNANGARQQQCIHLCFTMQNAGSNAQCQPHHLLLHMRKIAVARRCEVAKSSSHRVSHFCDHRGTMRLVFPASALECGRGFHFELLTKGGVAFLQLLFQLMQTSG